MDLAEARDRPWVSVVGSGSSPPEWTEGLEAVARDLARRGAVLVTGGLDGTMAAASRAYGQADGHLCVGILPGTDRSAANPHVDLPVVTGLGHVRNAVVAANGDAVVAFPGAGGTASEVGFARIRGTPVLGMRAWEEIPGVVAAHGVDEALEALDGFLEEEGVD